MRWPWRRRPRRQILSPADEKQALRFAGMGVLDPETRALFEAAAAGDVVAAAEAWLVLNPEGPLATRVAMHVTVLADGDPSRSVRVAEVADRAGCTTVEAQQALSWVVEQREAIEDGN